ncbi:MAG: TrkH family potassium uptake protein [Oscillospiraceae bacterium]|nr:TrkH family potassium uptake protein [Oscillospiraceae bacterium]
MNYRIIAYTLGWVLNFEALFMAVPAFTALYYSEGAGIGFVFSLLICLFFGVILTLKKPAKKAIYSRDGLVIVSLSWIVLSLFGALPFYVTGVIPSFIDAVFESAAGFTTTGASILSEVESLPRCILMWRSFTHWIGGMGVLVFIMAFVPLSGGQNMYIMKAESPGPSVSKFVPKIKATALLLYSMYFILTLAEFVFLLCGGMSVFESLNTALSTAGTGGFGFRNNSFESFSPYIQWVVTVFMFLFGVNFSIYFLILSKRIKEAMKSTELRVYILLVVAVTALITVNVSDMFATLEDAVRNVAFTVVSLVTTTGFATVDFNKWPELSRSIIVILLFTGACAGSTCGGIKLSRIILLFKSMSKELRLLVHPKQVHQIKIDGRVVSHETVRSVNVFLVCYMLIMMISFILISFDNHDLITNFTAVSATLNNVGPGLGLVGPTSNYGFFSGFSKLVLIFDMIAGRLELFPMLALFSPYTWKDK